MVAIAIAGDRENDLLRFFCVRIEPIQYYHIRNLR